MKIETIKRKETDNSINNNPLDEIIEYYNKLKPLIDIFELSTKEKYQNLLNKEELLINKINKINQKYIQANTLLNQLKKEADEKLKLQLELLHNIRKLLDKFKLIPTNKKQDILDIINNLDNMSIDKIRKTNNKIIAITS